ncbi:MAG: AmmeMemoRadiSam system protein A [Shimia sp.]
MPSTVELSQKGRFWPADAAALGAALDMAWVQASAPDIYPKARAEVIVSPHAGYRFCADVAARAYRAAQGATRVLLLSPSHYMRIEGCVLPSHLSYETGLGPIKVDAAARDALLRAGLARIEDAAHEKEHGIQTQLPMMVRWLGAPAVLPVVVGRAQTRDVTRLIRAWRKAVPGGLVVVSSDLSHRMAMSAARTHDLGTAQLIETAEPSAITPQHACGWSPLRGALATPEIAGMRCLRLGMKNSGLVNGRRTATVGYGAWAMFASEAASLNEALRGECLRVARQALRAYLKNGRAPQVRLDKFAVPLKGIGAAFVTWSDEGRLRGCIGSLSGHRPLILDVAQNAIKAGVRDKRFKPITLEELPRLRAKVAVLTRAAPMRFASETDLLSQIVPGRDGLILRDGAQRGTFLPMVWDSLATPEAFLKGLKRKAGLAEDHWSDTLTVHRFMAESFAERP